jgi:hypothetical protein
MACQVIRNSKNEIEQVLAPNGKESILFRDIQALGVDKEKALDLYSQTQTPSFKKWFENSEVIDANGEPLIVYHGSQNTFDTFDTELLGTNTGALSAKKAFFFAREKAAAEEYIEYSTSRLKIIPSESTPSFDGLSEVIQKNIDKIPKEYIYSATIRDTDGGVYDEYFIKEGYRSKVEEIIPGLIKYDVVHDNSKRSVGDAFASPHEILKSRISYSEARKEVSLMQNEGFGNNTYPVFLNVQNLLVSRDISPGVRGISFDQRIDHALERGHDGVVMEKTYDPTLTDVYAVFRSNQIKSVFNQGTFTAAENSIYLQKGESNPFEIPGKLQTLAQKLNNRFGISYSIVNQPSNPNKGWFNGKGVTINLAHANKDTVFHEYLHPFILTLEQENPTLYKDLINQLRSDAEGIKTIGEVQKKYPELGQKEQIQEALVEYLGKLSKQKYDKPSSPFNRFVKWLRSLFKKIQIDFKTLSLDTTLSDIADMIVDDIFVADLRATLQDAKVLTMYQKPDTELTYEAVFDRIKDKVSILNATIRNRKKGDQFKEDIGILNDIIQNQDEITSINNFISNAIHYVDQAQKRFETLRTSVKDPSKLSKDQLAYNLGILGELQQLLNVYQSLDDVKSLLVREGKDSTDDTFSKLRDAIDKKDLIIKDFKSFSLSYLTEWLFPYIEATNKNLEAEGRKDMVLSKEKFREQMVQALRDISAAGTWLGTTINSRDPVSAAIGLALKDVVYDNHVKDLYIKNLLTEEYDNERGKALYKSSKDEETFNKQFLREAEIWEKVGEDPDTGEEKWEYQKRLAFHGQFLSDQFEKAKKKFYKDLGPRPPATEQDKLKAWKKAQGEWYSVHTQINPKADNIIDENRRKMSARQFEEWWLSNTKEIDIVDYGYGKTNMDYYGARAVRGSYDAKKGTFRALSGELIQPSQRYTNPNFAKLMNNAYYSKLYNAYLEANKQLGDYALKHGVIPQISKGGNAFADLSWKDGLKKNAGKLWDKAVESIEAQSEDDRTVQRQDDSEVKNIPIYYTRMLNSQDLSLDLLRSVLKYSQMANNYRGMTDIEPNVIVLKTVLNGDFNLGIKGREVAKTNAKGAQIFNAITKKVVPKMAREDMLDARLNEFINDVVYGDEEFEQTVSVLGKDLSMNKISNKTALLTALQNMAGNINGGISNVAVGNFNNSIEAVGGRFYGKRDLLWAQKQYASFLPSLIAEITGQEQSFLNELADHYDVPQGEFKDHYGDNVSKGEFNKLMKTSTLFFIQKGGEHQIQTTAMLALMKSVEVTDQKDKSIKIPLFEALRITKADPKQMEELFGWTPQDDKMFRNRLHALVKNLHGVYNSFDKAMLQRRWYGKLALMFRKYLFKAITSRYGAKYVDYELGTVDGGYWREFAAKLFHDVKQYKWGALQRMWSKEGYDEFQSSAINKTIYELGVIIAVFVLIGVAAGGDDDDKSWMKSEMLLQLTRFSADITQYINPSDFIRVIRNPAASINMIEKWIGWFQQLFNPLEQYDRATGFAEAGDYKLWIKTLKLMPLVRQWINFLTPEEQRKFYNLTGR